MLNYIDRFGAQAVLGRPLGAGEIRRMIAADNVIRAYKSRQNSDNWATWAIKNPMYAQTIAEAIKLAGEDG